MFIDIAIPNNNEEEFILQAKKLDTKGLIFLYKKHDKKNLEIIAKLKESEKDFKIYSGILTGGKTSGKYDYIFSNGERKDFENKNTDIVFDLEIQSKKDNHHFRNSGLNHILCGLAKEKEITLAFNFEIVLNSRNKDLVLGRLMQNTMLCKKYSNKILIASFAKKPNQLRFYKDLIAFGMVLGFNQTKSKEAVLSRKL